MLINTNCSKCKEPTKYVAGFYDGKDKSGCIIDCKNDNCEIQKLKKELESKATKKMVKIQNWNGQHGMYAGHIAALRRSAKVTMREMSEIAGCSVAQYSAYEHERRKFDPEVYRKCEEYLKWSYPSKVEGKAEHE